ncbi:MAG: DUF952 domain-containing protein [Anaerolineaceae bacterium]|nr:DUF952 domain-containing protein [Anaerolineaceae bacterium]
MIYHITTLNQWKKALESGAYLPAEYAKDGFIHASEWYQLEGVANRFYQNQADLIVLEIETRATNLPLVYENLEGGLEPFPHIYGPLPLTAVIDTFHFITHPSGRWRVPPHKDRSVKTGPTLIPFKLPGKIYRSCMPFSSMFDPNALVFAEYAKLNIQVIVILNEADELFRHSGRDLPGLYKRSGYQVIHTPMEDFSAPVAGTLNQDIQQVHRLLLDGVNAAIHCHAGIGRTGIFLACLAQDILGLDGDESIIWLRQFIPNAVENEYQRAFVLAYQQNK